MAGGGCGERVLIDLEGAMRSVFRGVVAVVILGTASTSQGQWLKYPTPGTPRTASGAPNLAAPAPRTAEGKPDFSGIWGLDGGPSMFYLPGGLKPDEIKPFVGQLLKERGENFGKDDQQNRCLPEGPRFNHFPALPRKIVQTPGLMLMLSEDMSFRQIFLDGRPLPKDPTPSFMGYSVGHWEGDTLVVESIGFKEATWLDFAGNPHTEGLKLTERFRRLNFGEMEIVETFEDPAIYSRPMTVRVKGTLVPDTDLLEYVCAENERDRPKLIGTATAEMKAVKPVKVAPEILKQYAGEYDFRWPENPTVPSVWPIAFDGGQLLLNGAPLIPLSETEFLWAAGNRLRFVKDGAGRVTHFVITLVEGDLVVRKMK
jgi:hypothetical protein